MDTDMDIEELDDLYLSGNFRGEGIAEEEEKKEEKVWLSKSVDEQCRDVLNLLIKGERSWLGIAGDESIAAIEPYKITAILNRWDSRDTTTPTALHVLAKESNLSTRAEEARILKPFVKCFLNNGNLRQKDTGAENNVPVMKTAVLFKNNVFVTCVKECWPQGYADLLHDTDKDGTNCMHLAFQKQYLRVLAKSARADTIAAKDRNGNTPLHYAVDYSLCRKMRESHLEYVKQMVVDSDATFRKVGEFNVNEESPYLYYKHTKARWEVKYASPKVTTIDQVTANLTLASSKVGAEDVKKRKDPAPNGAKTSETDKPGLKEPLKGGEMASASGGPDEQVRTTREGNMAPPRLQKLSTAPKNIISRSMPTAEDGFGGARRGSVSLSRNSPVLVPGTPISSASLSLANALDQSQTQARAKIKNPSQAQAQVQPTTQAPTGRLSMGPDVPANPTRTASGEVIADKVEEFLRLHYIRERTEWEARELIYGKASNKNLSFHAMDHKYQSAEHIVNLVAKLSKAGGFDSTLASVNLPTISQAPIEDVKQKKSYSMNQKRTRDIVRENPTMGRTGLVAVFNKLFECKVRRILLLQVEDRDKPPHTDAAIEEALRGRQSVIKRSVKCRDAISVEVWDWRKPDLSINVIAFAAQGIKTINLYWSGNATVLEGWKHSICDGPSRPKDLKKIILHASPGWESYERVEEMIKTFKEDIHKLTNNEVTVYDKLGTSSTVSGPDPDDDDGSASADASEVPQQHDWVTKMEDFRRALISIHIAETEIATFHPPRVKVALIDDGVDLNKVNIYKVDEEDCVSVKGASYCDGTWYRSSRGHGTIMANMILRINPWAEIHAMQLRSSLTSNGRNIYADSAAKAIMGAIEREVDIISMSWTIKHELSTPNVNTIENAAKETADGRAIRALQKAIEKAKAKGIIMFCSASDNIQSGGKDTLPFNCAQDYLFRIGAARSLGERDPATEDIARINYYFPGNQVGDAWNQREAKTVVYHNGSSVATALAAGLASLIIYLSAVAQSFNPKGSKQNERFEKFGRQLRVRDNMQRAFNNIDSDQWSDPKYLPVWHMFGSAASNISDRDASAMKRELLEELVVQLCNKLT